MKNFYLISFIVFVLAFCFWLAEVDNVPLVLCVIGGVLFVIRYFHDYAKDPKPLKWKSKSKSHSHWSDYAVTPWDSSDCGGA